jgi:hypothetical protein|tara:strand:- start:4411 stop:4698 length:288 start_codon:yes stop_codon:yes gene_type:complete
MSAKSDFVLGKVEVHSTEKKGHDPEFWAAQATKKIVSISDNAPEHIKQQALAFQNQVYTVILYTIKNAIKSQNTTYSNILSEQGHEDMAKILREL